jgi:hypothetical protein
LHSLQSGTTGTAQLGRKATFAADQTQELAEHVLRLVKLFFGLTLVDVRHFAGYFVEKCIFPEADICSEDETGIYIIQSPGCISGPRGQKQFGAETSWGSEQNVTAVCSVSASGNYIHPVIIYPRQ